MLKIDDGDEKIKELMSSAGKNIQQKRNIGMILPYTEELKEASKLENGGPLAESQKRLAQILEARYRSNQRTWRAIANEIKACLDKVVSVFFVSRTVQPVKIFN